MVIDDAFYELYGFRSIRIIIFRIPRNAAFYRENIVLTFYYLINQYKLIDEADVESSGLGHPDFNFANSTENAFKRENFVPIFFIFNQPVYSNR